MSDIGLFWDAERFRADLSLRSADLALDDGLETAVLISLFTDRRAAPDDAVPEAGADLRGWWGDVAPSVAGDLIGSRLWQLSREKQTATVVARAREYAEEALAWLVIDGVAESVVVEAQIVARGVVGLGIQINRPSGPSRMKFDYAWEAL